MTEQEKDFYGRNDDARHKILTEVLDASQIYFEPNKMRFINDAMEMYSMYREAPLIEEIRQLKAVNESCYQSNKMLEDRVKELELENERLVKKNADLVIQNSDLKGNGKELAIGFAEWIDSSTWIRVKDGKWTSEEGIGQYIATSELFSKYIESLNK